MVPGKLMPRTAGGATMLLHPVRKILIWVHGLAGRDGKLWARKQDPSVGVSNDFTFLIGVVEDVCVMETWNPEKAASWNQAPKLHYCLDYDRQKAELFVTRLEGMLLADFHGLLCGLPEHLWLQGALGARGALCNKQAPEACDPQIHRGFSSLSYTSPNWGFPVGGHLSSKQ